MPQCRLRALSHEYSHGSLIESARDGVGASRQPAEPAAGAERQGRWTWSTVRVVRTSQPLSLRMSTGVQRLRIGRTRCARGRSGRGGAIPVAPLRCRWHGSASRAARARGVRSR